MQNTIRSVLLPALIVEAMLMLPAVAEPGKTIRPYASYWLGTDNNVLRLPDNAQIVGANGQGILSDTINRAEAGVVIEKHIGAQTLNADLNISRTRFARFAALDNTGRDLHAGLAWRVGAHLSGGLGGGYRRSLTPFTDFHQAERNMSTEKRQFFDAVWQFHPSWRLRAGGTRSGLGHDLAAQAVGDANENAAELGLDYLARSDSGIGAVLRHARGWFPHSQSQGGELIDRDFVQNALMAKIDWRYSDKTRLQFLGGWVARRQALAPQRDFTGTNARLIGDWSPSAKLALNVNAWREIAAAGDVRASYSLNHGLSIAPSWNPSGKIKLEAALKFENVDYSGGAALQPGLSPVPIRRDRSRKAELSLVYTPLRQMHINAAIGNERQQSNNAQIGYRATTATLSVRYAF